jgi:hypothetical protein
MFSQAETEREHSRSRHLRIGPFFKALLISVLVEFVVLVITGGAMASSMMRHSGVGPKPKWEDLLAGIFFIFHFIAFLIATPLGLFFFTPLIQIALMTCGLGLIFRARAKSLNPPSRFLS